MNKAAKQTPRPKRNITWRPLTTPACDHPYEAVTRHESVVFRHGTKCGRQEAE